MMIKARAALLTNKIPGLVDFGSRLGPHLADKGIDLVHLGSSRFDVLSEAAPALDVLYLSDYVNHNPAISEEVSAYVDGNISSGIFWSDIDRAQCLGMELPKFYENPHIAHQMLSFFLDAIDHQGIGVFIYEPPSNCFGLAAWHASQMRGIPYLGLMPARVPGRFQIISRPFDQSYEARMLWQQRDAGAAAYELADTYLARMDGQTLEYMRTSTSNPQGMIGKYVRFDKFHLLKHELEVAKVVGDAADSMSVPRPMHYRWAYVRRTWERNRRIGKVRPYFTKSLPNTDYVIYPIHLHPEASTSIYGAKHSDEFHTITRIASNLPIGMKLVVKDHIHAFGLQPLSFYEKLSKMPNVVLLDPYFDIKEAIRHAKAMVTNTSTAGFEALALGCPVLLLGEAPYNFVPWCVPTDNIEDIFHRIRNLPAKPSPEDCRRFVATYVEITHPGIFNFLEEKSSEKLEGYIANHISHILEE